MNYIKLNETRVLYVDPISYSAHKYYNTNNIRILSKICRLSIYVKSNYIESSCFKLEKQIYWDEKYCWDNIPHKSRIGFFVRTMFALRHNILFAFNVFKKNNYDMIIFSCIDLPLFSFLTKFKKTKNIFLIDHGLYLAIERKYVRFFWKHLNERINVCLLEEYFYQFLRRDLKVKNPVYLLKHPISQNISLNENEIEKVSDKYLIFAPSSSNSLYFAKKLSESSSLIPKNIKIIYKSLFDYEDDNLLIYSKRLLTDEYLHYFYKSNAILIPYDNNYNYRTSGVIFDAAANNKRIILKSGNTLEYYAKKYSDIFTMFDELNDFFELISSKDNILNDHQTQFMNFIKDYDDEEITREFVELLNRKPIEND
ncbi:MAG: hypothetical protein IJS58_04530 [Bacilli bacterium]|nr:hypothetical protein [Bacilli bacterium]